MKVKVEVKNKTKLKKVKEKTQQANFKSIDHAAGYIRKTILNSIRKGTIKDKKRVHSKPGQRPKTWDNKSGRAIKKSIGYKITRNTYRTLATIYAMPLKAGDRVYWMLEEGGSQYVEISRYADIVNDRTYRRSKQSGWKENNYKPMAQRSEGQQRHIKEYYQNVKNRKIIKMKVHAKYTARPFMMPAVKKNLQRFPSIWRTYIRQCYH